MTKATTRFLLASTFIILLLSTLTGCRKSARCEGPVCQHGGYCLGDTCACPLGYSGALCENFNVCDTIKCLNGGYCVNGGCQCATGYYGLHCDSLVRDLYLGTYTGTLTLSTSTTGIPSTATVTTDTSNTGVTIAVDGFTMTAQLTSGGNFNIPSQSATIGGFALGSLSGSGSFSGSTLNFTFAENIQVTTINASFVGTK